MSETRALRKGSLGLKDIASAANVSVATVSRVLSGSGRVDPAMRRLVLDTAAKLKIDPVQRNRPSSLAFILSNRSTLPPFHASILVGAEAYCTAHGWDLLYCSFTAPPNIAAKELHLPKVLQRRDAVRGVILAGNTSPNLLELLEQKDISYVVLGNNILGETSELKNDVVFSGETKGGEEMTRYLVDLGHQHVWFVGNTRLPWFARYYEGYRRCMQEVHLQPRLSSIDSSDEMEIGYLGTKYLLSTGEPVTAIFAGNDATACGVYKGLRERGLRIPEDISVAGCNDTVGGSLNPGLTTIREFPEQVGRHMAELLLQRMAKPDTEPRRLTMPTEFVKRDSCSAPSESQLLQETVAALTGAQP